MRPDRPTTRSQRALLVLLAGVLAILAQVAPDPRHPAEHAQGAFARSAFAQGGWRATFDGRPGAPLPWRPSDWDVAVHSRDVDTWKQLEPMPADHGPGCEAAPRTHWISSYDDAVFLCNDHMMTAINAEGYGLIVLTPNQAVDFATGEAVVRFDMTTLRMSGRDWVSVWLSPFDDHLQLPLADWLPDLSGEPRRGVEVRMGFTGGRFQASVVRDFVATSLPVADDRTYEDVLVPSAVRRDAFELRISRTSLKFGMPDYGLWWIDTPVSDLGWSRGLLQLQHHSYTPLKGCLAEWCGPGTWHWDNVSISSPVPFTLLRGDRRFVDGTTPPTVTFPSPAPPGSYLRFAGIGTNLQVSFDNGASWRPATIRPQERIREEHFRSYLTRSRPASGACSCAAPTGASASGWRATFRSSAPRARPAPARRAPAST